MYKENQEYCENVIAVSNRHLCKRPFLEQIKIVCEWHPKALILREKDLTEAEYEQLAGQVMKICKTYKVPCILHNFWQIAVKLNSNQIHLPLPVLRQLVNQAVIQEKNQGSGTFYRMGLRFTRWKKRLKRKSWGHLIWWQGIFMQLIVRKEFLQGESDF